MVLVVIIVEMVAIIVVLMVMFWRRAAELWLYRAAITSSSDGDKNGSRCVLEWRLWRKNWLWGYGCSFLRVFKGEFLHLYVTAGAIEFQHLSDFY
jgi:hypothetical protein